MSKSNKGTYLVEYWNGDKYIHGNNYKSWWVHAIETTLAKGWYHNVIKSKMFKAVSYSTTPFVDDGGLKYCSYEGYQDLIEEVIVKTGKKLKPLAEYVFEDKPQELAKLDREMKRY